MSAVISLTGSGEDPQLHFLMLHTTRQVLLKIYNNSTCNIPIEDDILVTGGVFLLVTL